MSELKKLALVGGGGTSADILTLIASINRTAPRYEVVGLLDDALAAGSMRFGVPVLGGLADGARQNAWLVDCLGSPGSYGRREQILRERALDPERFETIIHPSAFVAGDARLGPGCILYPNVVVLAGVSLGDHVTVLANSVLNHGVEIGAYSIVASGVNISGGVRIGRAAYLGGGSSVREGIHIGDGALIGLGSAVVKDVAAGMTVVGNPARALCAGS